MEENQVGRPDTVGQGMVLLYVTLGIGVLRSIIEASRLSAQSSVGFIVFVTLAVLGLMWFFIYMIGQGRNWARVTFLVLFIIGIPLAIPPLLQSLAANPISGLLGIGQTVLQIVALVFLFQKSSSEWFRQMKARR